MLLRGDSCKSSTLKTLDVATTRHGPMLCHVSQMWELYCHCQALGNREKREKTNNSKNSHSSRRVLSARLRSGLACIYAVRSPPSPPFLSPRTTKSSRSLRGQICVLLNLKTAVVCVCRQILWLCLSDQYPLTQERFCMTAIDRLDRYYKILHTGFRTQKPQSNSLMSKIALNSSK